jgi:hypothetical protein
VANAVLYSRVYVRNLEERVKPEPLREALHAIFSEYGNVIDIVAKTNLKAKGQAFIVFDSPDSARQAVEEVQGFELFEKPMEVAIARTRSDASVARFGTEEEFETHKRRRIAEKGASAYKSSRLIEADDTSQIRRRPSKLPKSRSGSSGQAPRPQTPGRPRLGEARVSNPRVLVPRRWCRTSTCLQTRSSSCRTCRMNTMSRRSPVFSAASKASGRYDWCPGEGVLPSWNMRLRVARSPRRRTRLA